MAWGVSLISCLITHRSPDAQLGSPEEQWMPFRSTLLQVLVSIQSMILIDTPYYNEYVFVSFLHASHAHNDVGVRLDLATVKRIPRLQTIFHTTRMWRCRL